MHINTPRFCPTRGGRRNGTIRPPLAATMASTGHGRHRIPRPGDGQQSQPEEHQKKNGKRRCNAAGRVAPSTAPAIDPSLPRIGPGGPSKYGDKQQEDKEPEPEPENIDHVRPRSFHYLES